MTINTVKACETMKPACLRAQSHKLPHMGIINGASRNTLANANKMWDWQNYADFTQHLTRITPILVGV